MKKKPAAPSKRLLLEELEPRLLLSADLSFGLAVPEGSVLEASVLEVQHNLAEDMESADAVLQASVMETQTLRFVVPDDWNTTDAAVTQTHELVIVNLSTPDYEILIDDLVSDRGDGRQFEVVILDADRGGIEQLSALLSERTGLDAVHIISHGADGSISLGNDVLDLEALIANAETIQGWGNAFTADGDLLIYGCNLAAGEDGRAFIDALGRLTGTDIAASTDLTGDAGLGGDWDLEYRQGTVEAEVAVSAEAQHQWDAVLVAPVVTVDTLTTRDTTPQLTGTIDNSTAPIVVSVGGQTRGATNNGDGTWTLADNSLNALADGTYDVAVSAVDAWTTDTVRDEFGAVSYANNNGSVSWTGDWIEDDGGGGGASAGLISVTGNQLRIGAERRDDSIYRQVDLSTATTATLTFDSDNQLTQAGEVISVQISGNGGTTWTTLKTYDSSNNGVVAESFDIINYMAVDTQIRFNVDEEQQADYLYIDNVEISYVAWTGNVGTDATTNELSIDTTNAPPTATNLNAAETYTEDTPLDLIDIVITDVDSANVTAILTLSIRVRGR